MKLVSLGLRDPSAGGAKTDKDLEKSAIDRDSRVKVGALNAGIPSNAMHVKLRANRSGPPDKAKYYSATDSEQVPRGKGKKNPCEGSEIDLATTCLQCVGVRKDDGLPFA